MWYTIEQMILALSGEKGVEKPSGGGHLAVAVSWWAHMCTAFPSLGPSTFDGCRGRLTGACSSVKLVQQACGQSA